MKTTLKSPIENKNPALCGVLGLLFSLGLVLTFATQLRLKVVPIGLGEIFLLVWIIVVFSRSIFSTGFIWSVTSIYLLAFWIISLLLLGIGWATANYHGIVSTQLPHNLFAYLFIFALCLTLSTNISCGKELDSIFLQFILIFGCVYLVIYPLSLLFPSIFGISLFKGISLASESVFRFNGFADNPNQMALVLTIAPFIGITLIRKTGKPTMVAMVVLILLFALMGLHTRTEALILAWLVGCLVLLIPRTVLKFAQLYKRYPTKTIAYSIFLVVICVTLFIKAEGIYRLQNIFDNVYAADGNQGDVRFGLITNGITAFLESPIVGLGPGSFSGYTEPFANREAHNTAIDWATQTGSVGFFTLLCLVAYSIFRALRTKRIELVAGLASLIVFAQFHFILRQPLVWVFLVYVMTPRLKTGAHPTKTESDDIINYVRGFKHKTTV